jgi:Gram-negative bacterial TonB protein C-terminal
MAAVGYLWQDPVDLIAIQVDLNFVDRLVAAIQQNSGIGSRAVEVGGFLLGQTSDGDAPTVLIEDFELVPCQHLRGASYSLSAKEQQQLGARVGRRRKRQVVGFFRTHTRPGLYLDQDDLAVFSRYFPEAARVFLLVRPSSDGPATGGFFFWEDGDINRRAPYSQFPFDSVQLGGTPGPRLAPLAVQKPVATPFRERLPRKPLPITSMVVPLIAVLFLVAAFLVSSRSTKHQPVATKPSRPAEVEALLPEPVVRQATAETTIPAAPEPPRAIIPAPETTPASAPSTLTPVEGSPVAAQQPKPSVRMESSRKKRSVIAKPLPRPLLGAPGPRLHQLEAPPVLAAAIDNPGVPHAALLPSSNLAAPPAAEVSYDAPHPGVLRRAIHKIVSDSYVPPSPVRKVPAVGPSGAGSVDVRVFINESGNVTRAQVLTKGTNLAAASLEAASQWQFTPAHKHDKPVASEMVLHFRF